MRSTPILGVTAPALLPPPPTTQVRRVFEALFECTLTMITKNFEDYPEHRLQFFALLHAIVNSCFK